MILIFVLTLADDLSCAWFTYPISSWCWCPDRGTNSINFVQMSRFNLKIEREFSLRDVVLYNNRTMDNVQKHNNFIYIPSSQTFRSS
jgi:hypothetical protein